MFNYYNTGVTAELGQIVESGVNVWDFVYPSYYKDAAKAAFEQKVLDHYRFRQIGAETVGRWLHLFRTRVCEIMPYYIQLYESCDLMAAQGDPFEAYNLREEFTRSTSGSGSTTGSSTDTGTSSEALEHRYSNTPQGTIENLDEYLTEATVDAKNNTMETTRNDTGSTTSEGSETYTLTRRGNIGVQPLGAEIEVYRKSLLNVDLQVIEALNDLFLGVY